MRKFVLLALLTVFAFGGAAFAQDDTGTLPPVACGDLPQEECDFLQGAVTAQYALQSAAVDLTFDLTMENIPDVPSPLTINITGEGAYVGDMSALADMNMSMMSNMNMGGMSPEQSFAVLGELIQAMNAELTLTVTLPDELLSEMGGATEIPNPFTVDLALVEGNGYINLDDFAALGAPSGWNGVNLVELIEVASQQMGAMGDMGTTGMEGMDPELMARFQNPEFINQFATVERLDDMTGEDGATVRVYQTTFDFAGLMASPEMQELMTQQMEAQGQTFDPAQMDMMGQMFEGMNLTVTQHIGEEDMFTRRTEMVLDWDMSALMNATMGMSGMEGTGGEMAEATPGMDSAGSEAGAQMGSAPAFRMHFIAEMSEFNAITDIAVPEGAVLVDLDQLGLAPMSDATGAGAVPEGVDEGDNMNMTPGPDMGGSTEGEGMAEATPAS
jgi:hypothetical protein